MMLRYSFSNEAAALLKLWMPGPLSAASQRERDAAVGDVHRVVRADALADPHHQAHDAEVAQAIGTDGQGVVTSTSTTSESLKNDGNKVDLETEMTALTETQIKYSAVSRLITNKFAQLSDVLGGR